MSVIHQCPLEWPVGWARARRRERSAFGNYAGVSVTQGAANVRAELERLHAKEIVITANVTTSRQTGQFRGDQREPPDTGVAVYFRVGDGQKVLANDKWTRVGDNLHAIAKHIEAIRGQGRWGCGSLDQALGGYKLLTAVDAPKLWYEVLNLPPSADWADVEAKRAELLARYHPDRGGSHDQAADINRAFENARIAFGVP